MTDEILQQLVEFVVLTKGDKKPPSHYSFFRNN